MQTIIPTARLRVTQRFLTVYYWQATFKMSILTYIIQIDLERVIQMLDVAFNLCN